MWHAAGIQGWETQRVGFRVHELAHADAVYGETMWARIVAEQIGMKILDPPQNWLMGVPQEYLGRKVQFDFFQHIRMKYPLFLKPADLKSFQARVYMYAPMLHEAELVIASEIVHFVHEVRTWMLDGRVQASSAYVVNPPQLSPGMHSAIKFAEKVAAETSDTPRAVVIDVGQLESGQWVVIEANPAYSSGIYDADPGGVLRVLQAACTI